MEVETVEGDFTKFLPEEVIHTIFAKLGPVDLCKVASVSSEVNCNHYEKQIMNDFVVEKVL